MSGNSRDSCPEWCVADHDAEDEPGHVRHRGETKVVATVIEGRGSDGPHAEELLIERSRLADGETWVYLGDGWTGFSLSIASARRLSAALAEVLAPAATLDDEGL